jgi:predicted DNA-binding protein
MKGISLRLDDELYHKLDNMAQETGVSRSELARKILSDSSAIQIINGSQIAAELFKISQLLEKDDLDDMIRQEISQACKNLKLKIKETFEKEGEFHGDSQGD